MFSLGNIIGSGAYGIVYHAQIGNLPCVAKVCDATQSEKDRASVQQEVDILRRLRHPHVIQFLRSHHEEAWTDGHLYLVMQVAERGSLADAIDKPKRGRGGTTTLDWPNRIRIANEIARGLEYIHYERILHRYLKSSNVLLTRHMEVKLGGFGFATDTSIASLRSETESSLKGSLRWMAPELMSESPKYSPKSDVYALGMVMWEMAANCTRPFKEQVSNAMVAFIVVKGEREELPEDTPTEYRQWVERCWHQDPQERPEASDIVVVGDEDLDEPSVSSLDSSLHSGSGSKEGINLTKPKSSSLSQVSHTNNSGIAQSAETQGSRAMDTPPPSLLFGQQIGEGGYGSVFHARWGNRKVAAKIFKVTKDEARHAASIQREIEMLERLQDRHIIQFYGTVYHQGKLVLIMDYAEGGSLNRAIKMRRVQTWADKIRIVQEIIRGVEYIHHLNILHRDLKSGNVLLTQSMDVKLCDFGLATVKVTSGSKSSGDALKGTVRWMAPELFAARPKYSTKSDMYALGMVMWEVAANCTIPFANQHNDRVVALAVERGERESLPNDTPSEYRAWVEQCWDANPTKRPEASHLISGIDSVENNTLEVCSVGSLMSTLSFMDDF